MQTRPIAATLVLLAFLLSLLAAAPARADDSVLAVINGTVHTVSGPTLRGATVLCENGKIVGVGSSVSVPESAKVIDAAGMHVYPGLIAVKSEGILEGKDPEEGSDVFSLSISLALAGGITTVETGNTAAKLTLGSVDRMVIKKDLFESLSYDTSNPAQKRRLREAFDRLIQHRRDVAAYDEARARGEEAQKPDDKWIRGDYQKYQRLLDGDATVLASASSAYDLLQLCELADRYSIRIVVRDTVEAWTVPRELGRAGVGVILSARTSEEPDPRFNRPTGSNIESASVLARAGVPVAILPVGSYFGPGWGISLGGLAGRDLLHLPMEAAFAVRGGLSEDAAVRAITLDAARILGVETRVGSIEPGKDADLVITDGNILHYMTLARWTIVNGEVLYDKDENSLFNHIRPGGDREAPPPADYWPRRLGDSRPD